MKDPRPGVGMRLGNHEATRAAQLGAFDPQTSAYTLDAAGRPTGTAAEFTVVPAERAVALPDEAGFDAGARHVINYRDGALPVGEEHGLPLVRFPLDHTADAHRAVESGTVGKILVDITS